MDFEKRTITVGRLKTEGGEGRVIPLNDEAFEILLERHLRFKDVKPDHYVFPSERYGFNGHQPHLAGAVVVYDLDPTKPMGSMKTAFRIRRQRRSQAGCQRKYSSDTRTRVTRPSAMPSVSRRLEGRSSLLYCQFPSLSFWGPPKSHTIANFLDTKKGCPFRQPLGIRW